MRTTSSSVPPASSTADLRFSHTCLVCTSTSPMPAMVPSARRDVMPEMKTSRPRASVTMACEKWPFGWRIFFEVSCFSWSILLQNIRKVDAGAARRVQEAFRGLRAQPAFSAACLRGRPRKLARRVDARDAGRALAAAHAQRLLAHARGEVLPIRKMSDVDREKEVAAAIGRGRIAVERPHLGADGAVGQPA